MYFVLWKRGTRKIGDKEQTGYRILIGANMKTLKLPFFDDSYITSVYFYCWDDDGDQHVLFGNASIRDFHDFTISQSVLSEMSSLSECSVMITTTGLKTAIYVNDIFQSPTGCEIITTTTGFEAVDATNATAGKAMRTNRKRRGIRERYHLREMPRKQRSATASPIIGPNDTFALENATGITEKKNYKTSSINPVDICLAILLGTITILFLSICIFIMVRRREQALCMFINRYSATNCSNFAFGPNSSYHSDTIHIRREYNITLSRSR
jgi:hypothetical protein